MKDSRCRKADIFALSLDGLLPGRFAPDFRLVYAPLADSAVILGLGQWEALRESIDCGIDAGEELAQAAEALMDADYGKLVESAVRHKHDFRNLTLLPTNKCNFACSFCYSAKGRSSTELDEGTIRAAIDFFIRPDSHPKLSLSILGGGEPLMAWPTVRDTIIYAEERAAALGKQLQTSITTNGSLVTDGITEFLKEHRVTTVVSYEILEAVQNMHRGHFEQVKAKIGRMFELGYTPQFNTVITPANVDLLCEIVETAHRDFPGIRYICTDPVILPELYHSTAELRAYHDTFIDGFFKARSMGEDLGIKVDCTANLSMDCTLIRYCPGEMGITAGGLVTLCPCVSSEMEPRFHDYIYGIVRDGRVEVDEAKLHRLLADDVNSSPRCTDCAMKYNCAGGCMHKNKMLTPEFKNETCRFTREFGRRYLFEKLDRSVREEQGVGIIQLLENENS